ncbi:MAG: hypothetical protein KDA96_12660, partial [Planctomycetaceae bacterium]|nr:hypothetical protein [Planctomycetaceae bacterium]
MPSDPGDDAVRRSKVLDREEYIEQEYFFRVYRERLQEGVPSQEILKVIQEEILATTRLPIAIDFMRSEILHNGRVSDAMARLPHYFAPFQAFVMQRADDDEARFEQLTALLILEREAHYRARNPSPAGLFVYQLECIARNRLGYTDGMLAMSMDPLFDDQWSDWIRRARFALGSTELAQLIFRASRHVATIRQRKPLTPPGTADDTDQPSDEQRTFLFGDQEGRIAKANIGRDPFYFFAALQRQLDYPGVPRSTGDDKDKQIPSVIEARLQKIEQRLKLIELEQKGGIDLTKFYRENREQLKPLE